MPCSKKEAQHHIFDKKSHERNLKIIGKKDFDVVSAMRQQ
jgi:hypothetical protein